ncbi:MAG: hypothetical protein AB2693_12490 [Candidatus Thiodiazotropha sp.]
MKVNLRSHSDNLNTITIAGDEQLLNRQSRMADFAGPVHVVLEVSESEAVELADICTGFHLVEELQPAEVT